MVNKQKEEIELLKQMLQKEKDDREEEMEKMREAFLKLAFLASEDCTLECCSKAKEQETKNSVPRDS